MYQNQQRHDHNASMSGMDLSAIMNDDDSFFNAYENSLIQGKMASKGGTTKKKQNTAHNLQSIT